MKHIKILIAVALIAIIWVRTDALPYPPQSPMMVWSTLLYRLVVGLSQEEQISNPLIFRQRLLR